MCVLGFGSNVDCLKFTYAGMMGGLLPPENRETSWSIVSMGLYITKSAPEVGFNVVFLQLFFFMITLAVPLAYIVALLVLWMVPLTVKNQFRMYTIAEILHSWAAIDVFVAAVLAANVEIGAYVAASINDHLSYLLPVVKELFDQDDLLVVKAEMWTGFWITLICAVALFGCGILIMQSAHLALIDRLDAQGYDGIADAAWRSYKPPIMPRPYSPRNAPLQEEDLSFADDSFGEFGGLPPSAVLETQIKANNEDGSKSPTFGAKKPSLLKVSSGKLASKTSKQMLNNEGKRKGGAGDLANHYKTLLNEDQSSQSQSPNKSPRQKS